MRFSTSENLPWLTVVMPTHQGERWLRDALDSLLSQNEKGLECLLIDSSPENQTIEIAESYKNKLNLQIHKRPDLLSWQSKTNFGFSHAKTRYVCMLHQDDKWNPERTTRIKEWISKFPNAVMHIHPAFIINGTGRKLGTWRCPFYGEKNPISKSLFIERLLIQNFISIPAPVIQRDAFLAVGGMNEKLWYTADWDIYLKLAQQGEFFYHPDVLSCFRIHGRSLTISGSRSVAEFSEQMQSVLDTYVSLLPEDKKAKIQKIAQASIRINMCLAEANNGSSAQLARAIAILLSLGPQGMYIYLRDSRLFERVLPRVRAKVQGDF